MRKSTLAIVHATLLVSLAATARAASPVLFLDRCAAGCAYGTEQDGVASLSGVTADAASVTTAKAAIDGRCGP